MSYCIKCKKSTGDIDSKIVTTKNNRSMRKAKCETCDTMKSVFIKSEQSGKGLSTESVKPVKAKPPKRKAIPYTGPRIVKNQPTNSGEGQDGEGIAEIKDFVVKSAQAVKSGIGKVIDEIRKNAPSKVKVVISKYGSNKIVEMSVCRNPVQKGITFLINILTKGRLEQNKNKLNYDNLFHLYMLLKLDNGVILRAEKNQTVTITEVKTLQDSDCMSVDVKLKKAITFAELLSNTENKVGKDRMWVYNIIDKNCQIWIDHILTSNSLNNGRLKQFILQDAETLLKDEPKVSKLATKVTDFAGALDLIIR